MTTTFSLADLLFLVAVAAMLGFLGVMAWGGYSALAARDHRIDGDPRWSLYVADAFRPEGRVYVRRLRRSLWVGSALLAVAAAATVAGLVLFW